MSKILVVDDDQIYRELISLSLKAENLEVVEAADGMSAVKLFSETEPDIVVLDIMLPDMKGFDVCKEIRKMSPTVPIIFLTALGDEDYQVIGYKAGGDDYITKPFRASVLTLKIRRMLERLSNAKSEKPVQNEIILHEDAFTFEINGVSSELTKKEFLLLKAFLVNKGRVLTRNYLIREVWGFDYLGDTRVVDTMVTKLRKKLGPAANSIKTVINVGYKMEDNQP